ncbi:MAG: polysaccharide deacetylase family protein [Bacteroidales bacterium]|nr:polysaccharide deacetylase family protein [Bacteroidales bacterium]
MTFDDGPVPGFTNEILSILNQFDAKATFFCVGENVKNHKKEFEEILKYGNLVGNHTFNHLKGRQTSFEAYISNILKSRNLYETKLFRPPYGRITAKQINEVSKKFKIIMWTVLTGDFDKNVSKEKCLKNAINYTRKGSIIVFHDNKKTKDKVLFALPKFLEYFSKKGYSFETLNENVLKF